MENLSSMFCGLKETWANGHCSCDLRKAFKKPWKLFQTFFMMANEKFVLIRMWNFFLCPKGGHCNAKAGDLWKV